jgi:hypothetical protein
MSDDRSRSGSFELPDSFRPATGTTEEWNRAYVRIEDYLRAHRIHYRLHQPRLIRTILERAAVRHAADPSLDPTVLAAQEIERLMDDWFSDVLDERGQPHARIAVDGRVALLLCDGPRKWPAAFLDEQHVPDEFVQAMRASSIRAGPDLEVSRMVARPIDFGLISEAAEETLEQFERWPILRTLGLWLLFAGALAAVFYATR